jgi:ABC-2 type transport system permease protein
MTSKLPAAAPAASVEAARLAGIALFATQVLAVIDAEVRKLRHDPLELLTRAVQPILWLLLLGRVMAHVRGLDTGNVSYIDFLAAGVLAQCVLFVAIFYGISAIWERDLGVLQRYLVSPAPRIAIVTGKAVSASIRGLSQAVIVYLLVVVEGTAVMLDAASLVGVVLLISLGAALFATLSLIIACKTRERFMGIGQVLTMPIFFVSNAIYPLDLMPQWLRTVAAVNPLTYEVDGLRALMIPAVETTFGLATDFAVLLAVTAAMFATAARLYPRMAV